MVAHPEHGVAVRKLYDPRGVSTPAMIQRKEEAGRALGDNPHFAKFLGSAPTPHGGGQMHFNEFVPQTAQPKPSAIPSRAAMDARMRNNSGVTQTGKGARAGLQQAGYEGHDIRGGNMVQDARTGNHKVIDYIPARAGEMTSSLAKPNQMTLTPQGAHLINGNTATSTQKGMLGGMLGGTKPMGQRRNVGVSGDATLMGHAQGPGATPQAPNPARALAPNPGKLTPSAPSPQANVSTGFLGAPPPKPPNPAASEATGFLGQPKVRPVPKPMTSLAPAPAPRI